jgi:hypothetical protein
MLLFLPAPFCEAQIVVGHLTEADSRNPVDGALVILVRENGEEEDRYLTNSAGRYRLGASSPGTFRIRAERIGYETVSSSPFELASGQLLGMDLETAFVPITLEGIDVEGEHRCVVRPEEGVELAILWEEARKALSVQDWTEQEGLYEYQVSNYERVLGPYARVVQAETRETDMVVARLPYRSLPVGELLTQGFIRQMEDGLFEFRAPDAAVLLSDPFLDTHCLQLAEDQNLPGSIGLFFEPVADTDLSDIEGTLWLERESAKLQFLEYRYTKVPYPGATGAAGGRVEFQGLPNGSWIVDRWWIRMPKVTRVRWPGRRAVSQYQVTSFTEAGGEVRQVYSAEQLVLREMPWGSLTGVAWDSTGGQPLSGAVVSLSGTSHESVTDSTGRFSMAEIPEGVFRADISHPILDSLGVALPGTEVEITRDEVTEVELGIPSMETLLATLCESAEEEDKTFTLVGTVRKAGSEDPIPRAAVTISWDTLVDRSRVDLRFDYTITETRDYGFDYAITDIDGRYFFCGLPPETELKVSASFLEYLGDTLRVQGEIDSHEVLNLNVQLPPDVLTYRTSTAGLYPAGERQGIQGRVVDPATGAPVPNAEVTVNWTQGEVTSTEITNSQGFFRVLTPWIGTFVLRADALGYKPLQSDTVPIEPGKLTVVEIELPPEPIALDPLVVVAESRAFHLDVNGFYERAQRGFGHFITPEEIEARKPVGLSDLLRDVPGLRVAATAFGTQVLFQKPSMTITGDPETYCEPRLYVDGMQVSQPQIGSVREETALAGIFPDQLVPLSAIAGLEVHTRSTGIPLAYGGTQGSCGVILIWTKGR